MLAVPKLVKLHLSSNSNSSSNLRVNRDSRGAIVIPPEPPLAATTAAATASAMPVPAREDGV